MTKPVPVEKALRSLYQIALCSKHKLVFSNFLEASGMSICKFQTSTSCTANEFIPVLLSKPGSVLWL